jgi:hypothetical protein
VEGWLLRRSGGGIEQIFPLPTAFDAYVDQQFRFRKQGREVEIAWEGHHLGTVKVPRGRSHLGLMAGCGSASFEAVRVVAL